MGHKANNLTFRSHDNDFYQERIKGSLAFIDFVRLKSDNFLVHGKPLERKRVPEPFIPESYFVKFKPSGQVPKAVILSLPRATL